MGKFEVKRNAESGVGGEGNGKSKKNKKTNSNKNQSFSKEEVAFIIASILGKIKY